MGVFCKKMETDMNVNKIAQGGVIAQRCTIGLSAVMEMSCIGAAQYNSHELPVAIEHLKCLGTRKLNIFLYNLSLLNSPMD